MKQLLCILLIMAAFFAQAQEKADTTYWTKGGNFAFNFSQISFSNWAAGGQNAVAGVTKLQLFGNYKKGNTAWDNKIDLGYGLSKVQDLALQKNEDIIDLQSKLGIVASKKLFYSALLSFKSQFAPGYSDATNTTKISNLFSPAYMALSLGMDYKPSSHFSLLLSPATGKMTIVTDTALVEMYGLEKGKTARIELGAFLKSNFNQDILKNVNLATEIGLFSNYLYKPQNIDVDWKVAINMKINSYLSASINTQLLYDADIVETGAEKAKIQFKELLGLGLNFKF